MSVAIDVMFNVSLADPHDATLGFQIDDAAAGMSREVRHHLVDVVGRFAPTILLLNEFHDFPFL